MTTFHFNPSLLVATSLVLATAATGCDVRIVNAPESAAASATGTPRPVSKTTSTPRPSSEPVTNTPAPSVNPAASAKPSSLPKPPARFPANAERLWALMFKQNNDMGLVFFQKMDKNRDNIVTREEVTAATATNQGDNQVDLLRLDANRDGQVNKVEMERYLDIMPASELEKIGVQANTFLTTAAELLRTLDTDKDGQLSKSEYQAGWASSFPKALQQGQNLTATYEAKDIATWFDSHASGNGQLNQEGVALVLAEAQWSVAFPFLAGIILADWSSSTPTPTPTRTPYVVKDEAIGAQIALADPQNLVVSPDGSFTVLDDGAIIQFLPGKKRTLLPKGAFYEGEWVRPEPKYLQRASNDAWAFMLDTSVYRLTSDGKTQVIATAKNQLEHFAMAPDAGIFLSEEVPPADGLGPGVVEVSYQASDGQVSKMPKPKALEKVDALSIDSQGRLRIKGTARVNNEGNTYSETGFWIWAPGAGVEALSNQTPWPDATDAQGRHYTGYRFGMDPSEANTIRRTDPRTGVTDVIVGPGGKAFTGTGVDDGVKQPIQPGFDAAGNLYFIDSGHKQIKKVLAGLL